MPANDDDFEKIQEILDYLMVEFPEGLSEHNGLFFLLMVKCPIIASDIGVEVGDIIIKYKK